MREMTHMGMPAVRPAPAPPSLQAVSQPVEQFSITKCVAGAAQALAVVLVIMAVVVAMMHKDDAWIAQTQLVGTFAGVFQVMALTFYMMRREEE